MLFFGKKNWVDAACTVHPPLGALRLDEFPSVWVPHGLRSCEGATCRSARLSARRFLVRIELL